MTQRMLDTLQIVKRLEPCTAQEVADELGVQMASARTYLQNLKSTGYAKTNGCNRWSKWTTCSVEPEIPEIVQAASVWEYAARYRMSQEAA